MESLADQTWDAIICGTGLQQSLLALALSRSGKQILHLDPNEFYGGREAALTLQEAEDWVNKTRAETEQTQPTIPIFSAAAVVKSEDASLSASRAYSVSLSPFIIHTRSDLVSQLVSSRAYRQLEFLAVGSFYVFRPSKDADAKAELAPIPSTREAIFATDAIQPRPKRALMKFLKFVMDYTSPENEEKWRPRASETLLSFMETESKLDAELRTLILSLTLSLDDTITVEQGIKAIHRHLTSMGVFGPGFAAVYPKYGGGSEVAQVGCRACAVGGGVYMLGTGTKAMRPLQGEEDGAKYEVELSEGDIKLRTRTLVREAESVPDSGSRISRLIAVVDSPLTRFFEPVAEDTPNPGVAVIAMPPGSVKDAAGKASTLPINVLAHSSETGECPPGQSVLYLTTPASAASSAMLEAALTSLLSALGSDGTAPKAIWQLRYEQAVPDSTSSATSGSQAGLFTFAPVAPDLAFRDSLLDPVKDAWRAVLGADATAAEADGSYMKFEDREGFADDEEQL